MKLPRASTVVASVFGIGYFEFAPGTIMSAIAVPLAILIALRGGGGMGIVGRHPDRPDHRDPGLRRSCARDQAR